MNNNKYKVFLSLLILMLLISCNIDNIDDVNNNNINKTKKPKISYTSNQSEIEILGMGDMIFHQPIVKNYKNGEIYDFTQIFSNIYDDINSADFAIANFEGTTNSNRKLSGFPLFNFPKESIQSLKQVGFDALSTANNHCLDTGIEGLKETINNMNDYNIEYFGTNISDNLKGKVIEINGIKVGLISFTDTLNGLDSIISDDEYTVNTFSQDVRGDIQKIKEQSDIVIVYPHWGTEYQYNPSDRQIYLKDKLFEYGADIILGSHPHVLQKYEDMYLNGNRKFVIYSMGNALSNQRQEYLHREGVETGCFVKIKILKDNDTNITKIENIQVVPTYVNRYWDNNKLIYNIVKLEDFKNGGKLENTVDLKSKDFFIDKLNKANKVLIGEEYV